MSNIRRLNLHLCQPGCWAENELPIIAHNEIVPPTRLLSFKECKKSKDFEAGVHFYIDDKDFEQVWTYPERYVDLLSKFSCVVLPDFSVYYDAANPINQWNLYRSRTLGMYWQKNGLNVVPTIPFAGFEFNCYATIGLPQKSVVAVSTVGSVRNYNKRLAFQSGIDVIWSRLHPQIILVYGNLADFSFYDMKVYNYEQFKVSTSKRNF